MFVWIFHRVSGVLLIVLMGLKIYTGFGILGKYGEKAIEPMRALHHHVLVDSLIIGLFIYHALYGLRTCLIDLGLRGEKQLFWIFTVAGTILFIGLTWFLVLPKYGT
jgi:succinate dehydrogenase/fumarate reductase cytochrome b subunit